MEMSVDEALSACSDLKLVASRLQTLSDLGLGYLTLGEATPSLSGGEAQRLKLASEMGRGQSDTVFVFDEPTIGLHPLDVQTLLQVFQRLIDSVNFEDEESMNWFHRQLRDRGIIDELRKKGAKEGSPVQLGDMEFDFIE